MKEIRKYYRIRGTAEEVYAALINPFAIALWTGAKAEMKAEAGTRFSLFDGDIEGLNLEFVENQRLVQEWFFGERDEKSIVTIILRPDRLYTKIELHHTNIPEDAYEDMLHGWNEFYFGGLKEFFEK